MAKIQDNMTITVVIATYNRRNMLERAVRSVLQEDRVPIIVRIHDNASTDDTEDFVRNIMNEDCRVYYTKNDSNIGCRANISASFRSVESAYFVPLADDDFLLPNFLFDAYSIMKADAELGAVAFYAEARDSNGQIVNTWPNNISRMPQGKISPADHFREWMTTSHYSWQAVLWNAQVLVHLGYPYLHTGLPSDVDFQLQIITKFPVYVVKRAGAVFSVHEGQASNGISVADVSSWGKIFKRLDKAIEQLDLIPQDEYINLRAILWHRMRPSWTRQSKTAVPLSTLARNAISAGFWLGDWELAFHLVAEVRRRTSIRDESQPFEGAQRESPEQMTSHLELGIQVLESLRDGMQREQALTAQLESLIASTKTLEKAALAVTVDRNRLAAELAALRLQHDKTEQPDRGQTSLGLPDVSAAAAGLRLA